MPSPTQATCEQISLTDHENQSELSCQNMFVQLLGAIRESPPYFIQSDTSSTEALFLSLSR